MDRVVVLARRVLTIGLQGVVAVMPGCSPAGSAAPVASPDSGPPVSAQELRHDPTTPGHLSLVNGLLSIRVSAPAGRLRSAAVSMDGRSIAMHRQLALGDQELWRGVVPEGTRAYRLVVEHAGGSLELGPFAVPVAPFRNVPWVGRAVGYQIFPDRFRNGDPANDTLTLATAEYRYLHPTQRGAPPELTRRWDGPMGVSHCCQQYFGGDLQGIIDQLDHLQRLGVTLLYLNPIWLAGSAHGYDTWDYRQVDPALGTTATLRALLEAAHARGMRVIWDFVPNHVGVGFGPFREAVQQGAASPYWSWFTFRVPAPEVQPGNGRHYDGWWGLGSLPVLETSRPAVTDYLMDVVTQWTRFGFDGIRVDVPNELKNRQAFFQRLRQTAKAISPEQYLVGEIWQRAPEWLQGDQFDALMNYPVGQEVIEPFVMGRVTAWDASNALAQLYAAYPEAATSMLFNVISTHDTRRLLTRMGGGALGATPSADAMARHRLASALLYFLPGVPVTFQGDECAFLGESGEGARDEHRYPMQWARCDAAMVAHYTRLATLRRQLPALQSATWRQHAAGGNLLAFWRGEPGDAELLLVANAGTQLAPFTLPAGSWQDAESGESASGTVLVAARGWRLLQRR